jgi:glucosamine-6-phosphate deaminase
MEWIVVDGYDALSRAAADVFAEVVTAKPDSTILVATGDTPMGLYQELAHRRTQGALDTSRLVAVQLDEYLGLGRDDHRSLYGWMERAFVEPLGIGPDRVVRLASHDRDPEAACRAFDRRVSEQGGIDLAVLGLGPNGHLGFNEPPSSAATPTRPVDLSDASLASNAAYWGGRDAVPRRALTAGMSIILAARRVLVLVAGEGKRGILQRLVTGPIGPELPASYVRQHDDATLIADRAAWPDANGARGVLAS